LQDKADIRFLTKSGETIVTAIRESGFDAIRLPGDAEILAYLKDLDPDVIVFDKIDVNEELARDIKATLRARLVLLNNLTAASKLADVAMIAWYQGGRIENRAFRDSNTLYYYGPKYWVLRPEFYQYRKKGKAASRRPERILLMFGGSDPCRLTPVVLEELLGMDRAYNTTVVLGAHFGSEDSVNQVLERHAEKRTSVTVRRNIQNVAQLMYEADLVIASPGLSVFEALCVGTPVLAIPQNVLQRDTYQGFIRMLERDEVGKLKQVMEQADFTYPQEEHVASMGIGQGVSELVEAILCPGGK
ncbi:MAG: hypothetical protein M3O85_02410, partial [Acidobacteriota bacterium]|nr:hypothetical protein [Acidobacteriota bacterium]